MRVPCACDIFSLCTCASAPVDSQSAPTLLLNGDPATEYSSKEAAVDRMRLRYRVHLNLM